MQETVATVQASGRVSNLGDGQGPADPPCIIPSTPHHHSTRAGKAPGVVLPTRKMTHGKISVARVKKVRIGGRGAREHARPQ